MDINRISLLPIEFLTSVKREEIENVLLKNEIIKENNSFNFFCKIDGNKISQYNIISFPSIKLIFTETSCCLIFENKFNNFILNKKSLISELKQRNELHQNIINNGITEVSNILKVIKTFYIDLQVNYVFSFYICSTNQELSTEEDMLLKYLAEPSVIELDDMFSLNNKLSEKFDIQNNFKHNIINYDISLFSTTYITWATMVCIVNNSSYLKKTEDILFTLELKLQIVWNKCYTIRKHIDSVIENDVINMEIDKFYLDVYRISQNSLIMLSSTMSTRVDKLFKGMIETSRFEKEIYYLRDKIVFLEKFIKSKKDKQSKKYFLGIEILIFITALSSVGQLLFPLPIVKDIELSIVIIAILLIFGIFFISRKYKSLWLNQKKLTLNFY